MTYLTIITVFFSCCVRSSWSLRKTFAPDFIGADKSLYSDVEQIGKGGFGTVYKATDATGKTVVIKKSRKHSSWASLRSEAELLLKLKGCPHMVQHVDHGETQKGQPFLVLTPFAKDGDLQHAKNKTSTSDWAKYVMRHREDSGGLGPLKRVATQILETLECMNSKHVIYSDLKMENLLFQPTEQEASKGAKWFELLAPGRKLLLTDFGLSLELNEEEREAAAAGELEKAGRECDSTPTIAPPECLSASGLYEGYSWSFDMFSLGTTLLGLGSNIKPPKWRDENDKDYAARVYNNWCTLLSNTTALELSMSKDKKMGYSFYMRVGVHDRCLRELAIRAVALLPAQRLSPSVALQLARAAGDRDACDTIIDKLPPRPTEFPPEVCVRAGELAEHETAGGLSGQLKQLAQGLDLAPFPVDALGDATLWQKASKRLASTRSSLKRRWLSLKEKID